SCSRLPALVPSLRNIRPITSTLAASVALEPGRDRRLHGADRLRRDVVSRAYRVPEAQMPTTKQQRRRALELLEASIDGCTAAIMLAYGFKTALLVELIDAGFARTGMARMVVAGRRVKVIRMRITAAGRRALAELDGP